MPSNSIATKTQNAAGTRFIEEQVDREIERFLASLPKPKDLTSEQRRGIIARYTSVLEGNFIYWMTGAYLAVKSDEAKAQILDNLREEVRDAHPLMMRRFAVAAGATPTDADALAVYRNLTNVRLFIGRLSAVRIVLMMAFFEGTLQRYMAYLAELAEMQGSTEFEYTDVHGVCDIAHTAGLYRALQAEMDASESVPDGADLYEGVELLRTLLQNTIAG